MSKDALSKLQPGEAWNGSLVSQNDPVVNLGCRTDNLGACCKKEASVRGTWGVRGFQYQIATERPRPWVALQMSEAAYM